MSVKQRTEYEVKCGNKAGELARIMESLNRAGVNVLAFCGYGQGKQARIYFVPDDDAKASVALKQAKVKCVTSPVVALSCPSGMGEGAKLARLLAEARISLDYIYASTPGNGETTVILGVPEKAIDKTLKVLY